MMTYLMMLSPVAFTSFRISLSMSPSAPDTIVCPIFSDIPHHVAGVQEELFEWCPQVKPIMRGHPAKFIHFLANLFT